MYLQRSSPQLRWVLPFLGRSAKMMNEIVDAFINSFDDPGGAAHAGQGGGPEDEPHSYFNLDYVLAAQGLMVW